MRRVFVSHGLTDDPARRAWLDNFLSAIHRKGWDTFEYRRDLQQGEAWRAALWQALLGCDAGVVLNDARAAGRHWVRYELAVLRARADSEAGFVQQTISLPGPLPADAAAMAGPLLQALASSWPRPVSPAVMPPLHDDTAFKALLDAFVLRARVARLLRRHAVHPDVLPADKGPDDSTSFLRLPLDGLPPGDAWLDRAQAVLRHPRALLPVLLARCLPPATVAQLADDLVVLSIPADAAAPLSAVFHGQASSSAWRAPASAAPLATLLLRRAWGIERPMHGAPVVRLHNWGDSLSALWDELQHALVQQTGWPKDGLRLLLDQLFKSTDDQNAAALCVVLQGPLDADALLELQHCLPRAVWVCCDDHLDHLPALPWDAAAMSRLKAEVEQLKWLARPQFMTPP